MPNVAKIIIRDKFTNKLVSLKLKEETSLKRVVEILIKRYTHLVGKEVALYFKGAELSPETTLKSFIESTGYTEKDRIEIQEKKAASPEPDYISMMKQGGAQFDKAVLMILIKGKVINQEVGNSTLESSSVSRDSFLSSLIQNRYASEKDILATISRCLKIQSVDLDGVSIMPDIIKLIPHKVADHYCILPIRQEGSVLSIAMVNPFDSEKINDLKLVTGMQVEAVMSTEVAIRKKIDQLYKTQAPADSPLPEDILKPKQIAIHEGKKVDVNDVPMDQFMAETIWNNKGDDLFEAVPEVQDDFEEIEPGKAIEPGKIWDAPTLHDVGEESGENKREDDLFNAIPIEDESIDIPEAPGGSQGAEINLESNFASEIPIFAGLDPNEIPEAVELSFDTNEPNKSDYIKTEKVDNMVTAKEEKRDEFDSSLERQIGITNEDINLESAIREEQISSDDLLGFGTDNQEAFSLEPEAPMTIEPEEAPMAIEAEAPMTIEPEEAPMAIETEAPMTIEPEEVPMAIETEAPMSIEPEAQIPLSIEPEAPLDLGPEVEIPLSHDSESMESAIPVPDIMPESGDLAIPPMPEMSIGEEDMPPVPNMEEAGVPPVLAADDPAISLPEEPTSAANINLTDILKSENNETAEDETDTTKNSDFTSTQIVNRKKDEEKGEVEEEKTEEEVKDQSFDDDKTETAPFREIEDDISGSEELTISKSVQDEVTKSDEESEQDEESGELKLAPEEEEEEQEEKSRRRKPSKIEPTQAIQSVRSKKKDNADELFLADDSEDGIPAELAKTRKTQLPEEKPIIEEVKPKKRKKISRETTVKYYKKMVPFRTFPLDVMFSAKKIQKIQNEAIAQTSAKKAVQVTEEKPCVKVVASFPGCLVEPRERIVDISPQNTNLQMWVTPVAEGKIKGAAVELWYENKCVEVIPVKTRVESQKTAKISAFIGIILPFISMFFDLFGSRIIAKSNILKKIVPFLSNISNAVGGTLNLGIILGGVFILLAIIIAFVKKSKKAKPVNSTVEFV